MDGTKPKRNQSRSALPISGVLFALGAISLLVDMPINQVRPALSPYNLWNQLWTIPELFGDGCGVLLICCTVFMWAPQCRRHLPRVIACAFCSGLVATILKPLFLRMRPRHFNSDGPLSATFEGFLPVRIWHGDWAFESHMFSLPSGHTATAVGFAVGLAWLFPHGRRWFYFCAAVTASQRIIVGAHYLSDTLFGACVGFLVASWLVDRWGFSARFDSRECTSFQPV